MRMFEGMEPSMGAAIADLAALAWVIFMASRLLA